LEITVHGIVTDPEDKPECPLNLGNGLSKEKRGCFAYGELESPVSGYKFY
jgi:hypothetical protein